MGRGWQVHLPEKVALELRPKVGRSPGAPGGELLAEVQGP